MNGTEPYGFTTNVVNKQGGNANPQQARGGMWKIWNLRTCITAFLYEFFADCFFIDPASLFRSRTEKENRRWWDERGIKSVFLKRDGESPRAPRNQYTLLMKFDFGPSRIHMGPCAS